MTATKQQQAPNILIVDDTPGNVLLLVRMLTERGYKPRPVLSGKLALQAARTEPPDLILLDITMPEMSGQELLRRMLQLNPAICILICSGYPFDVATLPATAHHQVGFLQKPFTPKMLAGSIEQLLAARNGAAPE